MDFYFNERKSEHTDGVQTQQKDLISFLKTLDTQDKKIAVTFDSLIKDKSYDKVLYCLNSANLYMFRSTRIE